MSGHEEPDERCEWRLLASKPKQRDDGTPVVVDMFFCVHNPLHRWEVERG